MTATAATITTPDYHSAEADALPTSPNFRRSTPQLIRDDWRHTVRVLRFDGPCVVCGRRTYTFDDGENDPRGVLGDHAGSALEAEDYPDDHEPGTAYEPVPVCFLCMNEEGPYRLALSIARAQWRRTDRRRAEFQRLVAAAAEDDPGEANEPGLCPCGRGYIGHDPDHLTS